jgi:hypothetical protein
MKKSKKTEHAVMTIQFKPRDFARCQRAASFCALSLEEWAWGSLMTAMECIEDDIADKGHDAALNPEKFAIPMSFCLGQEKCHWEAREALPEPVFVKWRELLSTGKA